MSKLTNIEDIYSLSPIQEGVLFHTLQASDASMYVNQLSFIIAGRLDISAFHRAWEDMIERHAILRTAMIYEHGQKPVQVVYRHVDLPLTEVDWSSLSSDEQHQRLVVFLQEDYERGLPLSEPPLIRLTLIKLAEKRYQVIWTSHHIIMDGWSRSLLIQELFDCYHAYCQGRFPLKKPTRPYRDYIAWLQKRQAQSEVFWRTLLEGKTASTSLAFDTPHKQESGQAVECRDVPNEIWEQLRSIARRYQVTVNTIIQGVWALLLSHYSQEQDVLFGATVAGRSTALPGMESMIGMFINTLPMRIRVRPNVLLSTWLQEIFALQSELLQHQHSSLVEVHRWSEIPRTLPLFENVLVFNNFPVNISQDQTWEGFEIQDIQFYETTNYPLCITVMPGTRLQLSANYDRGRFTSVMITHVLEHFLALLENIVTCSDQLLWKYSPLTTTERQNILINWNATQTSLPYERCFQQLFEDQAVRTPDTIALTYASEHLTYEQLNSRANQCAHHLRQQGIGPERVVALLAQRNIEFWVAMLGIMKAGGVYLPLDPRHPSRRLAQLLAQSDARLVLVGDELISEFVEARQHLPGNQALQHLILSELGDNGQSIVNPLPWSAPHNLVHIFYTSGSTGLPKGVMIEQRGMINHLYAKITDLHLGPEDCIAQDASQSFDVSIWQVLAPLLVGGRVHIFSDELVQEPLRMLAQAAEQSVTIIETVPSWLRLLLESSRSGVPDLPDLRLMFVMGETLPPQLCRWWMECYPHTLLMNAWGATECSDDVTHYPIFVSPGTEEALVPIGKPLANMRIYAMDSQFQPVPVGLAGELYIAGVGVGRGYYNDPARTAETFIPNPFPMEPGERLYRTGDEGRWRIDGVLEFFRRIDDQVKLRGIRIEPGEIEAILNSHPLVREATALIREDTPGDQRLVAYIVPRVPGQDTVIIQEIYTFLKQELPAWMVPSSYTLLEALPLNANGKLNRRALPVPDTVYSPEDSYEEPSNPIEEIVARCFAAVLEVEKVSIHANFFDLGGHSLLATQLITQLRTTFRTDIPFRAFFEQSTVAGVAQILLIHEPLPGQTEKIANILKTIQSMSVEEKQRLLEQRRNERTH